MQSTHTNTNRGGKYCGAHTFEKQPRVYASACKKKPRRDSHEIREICKTNSDSDEMATATVGASLLRDSPFASNMDGLVECATTRPALARTHHVYTANAHIQTHERMRPNRAMRARTCACAQSVRTLYTLSALRAYICIYKHIVRRVQVFCTRVVLSVAAAAVRAACMIVCVCVFGRLRTLLYICSTLPPPLCRSPATVGVVIAVVIGVVVGRFPPLHKYTHTQTRVMRSGFALTMYLLCAWSTSSSASCTPTRHALNPRTKTCCAGASLSSSYTLTQKHAEG